MRLPFQRDENRRRTNSVIIASKSNASTPPTTPPAMAPVERLGPSSGEAVTESTGVAAVVVAVACVSGDCAYG